MNLLIKFSFLAFMTIAISESIVFSQDESEKNRDARHDGSLYQPIQISFLPWMSTSATLSARTTCIVSINILSGITGTVTGIQLGSLVNFVREDAGKVQLGGLGNITGNVTSGIQCAGIFNYSKTLKGIQVSGIINASRNVHGSQISGILNYVYDTAGIQISGLLNHSATTPGCQLAGLINNTGNTNMQIAGLANIAGESPVQIAGVFNKTSGYSKMQASGSFNIADNIQGLQLGIINIARAINGAQIGIINLADSCHGVPVGIINIYRDGYHVLEISSDEMFYTNISFRSGIEKFHSIIIAGIRPENFSSPLWTYGGGFGSLYRLSDKNRLGIDAGFLNILKGGDEGNNYLYRVGFGIDHKMSPMTSLYLGFTGNWLSVDRNHSRYEEYYSDIAPYYIFRSDTRHTGNKLWLGVKLGLRLF